jgi:hypothetical protein
MQKAASRRKYSGLLTYSNVTLGRLGSDYSSFRAAMIQPHFLERDVPRMKKAFHASAGRC